MNRWCVLLITILTATVYVSCQGNRWNTREKSNNNRWNTRKNSNSNKHKSAFDKIFESNKGVLKSAGTSAFSSTSNGVELHEGDIVLTPKLKRYLQKKKNNPKSEDSPFDALTNGEWPKSGQYAYVPYRYATGFSYQSVVQQAIAEYNAKTCIRFRPYRSTDRNYIEFVHSSGCFSMIGKTGGRQQISLGRGCGFKGIAIHEMMHALGFFHEQSRLDRDSQIRINWNNIQRSMWYNFEKYKSGQASTLGEPYDKQSVMHYGNYAFSTNGQKTIVSLSNSNERLGQRDGLSRIDVNQLNKYYKCQGSGGKITTTTTTKKPPSQGCRDTYTLCPTLANTARLCSQSSWVKDSCKKSCNHSSCTKQVCKDKNRSCLAWAKTNVHCRYESGCCRYGSYVTFMRDNCQKSCGQC